MHGNLYGWISPLGDHMSISKDSTHLDSAEEIYLKWKKLGDNIECSDIDRNDMFYEDELINLGFLKLSSSTYTMVNVFLYFKIHNGKVIISKSQILTLKYLMGIYEDNFSFGFDTIFGRFNNLDKFLESILEDLIIISY